MEVFWLWLIIIIGVMILCVPFTLIHAIIYRKYTLAIVLSIICIAIVACFLNSDFYKERKRVDIDWLYGKTIDEVSKRYVPYLNYKGEYIKKEDGIILTQEIYLWDIWDGVKGVYLYKVRLNEENKVCEVDKIEIAYQYTKEHSYWERWGF